MCFKSAQADHTCIIYACLNRIKQIKNNLATSCENRFFSFCELQMMHVCSLIEVVHFLFMCSIMVRLAIFEVSRLLLVTFAQRTGFSFSNVVT